MINFSIDIANFFDKYITTGKLNSLKANFQNNISIDLDETYKVKNYNYKISGNLEKANLNLLKTF